MQVGQVRWKLQRETVGRNGATPDWKRRGVSPSQAAKCQANEQINSSTTTPTTPGTGSRPQLASMLREGRKNANIESPQLQRPPSSAAERWPESGAIRRVENFGSLGPQALEADDWPARARGR
jgi:hypothetical protein